MDNVIEIGGHTYSMSKAGAREGLRLLRGWSDVEAAQHDAIADTHLATSDRIAQGVHALAGVDENEQAAAVEQHFIVGQMHRSQAADYRAKAELMLTDERVRDLIIPTLSLATVQIGDGGGVIVELAGSNGIWESHFAGKLGELFELLEALRVYNFSDFFAVSPSGNEAEKAPEPAAQPAAPARSSGGSGTRSVRATARSGK